MSKPISLSDQQNQVIKQMESGTNLFITGNAGSGKSTVLRNFLLQTERKCVVLAPTGVAAMNVGGGTIHSFFKFGFGFLGHVAPKRLRTAAGIKQLDTIIIDEISMVRADILDQIDKTLQLNTGKRLPFGGIQIIMFGDLLQLPPVVRYDEDQMFRDTYGGSYFFHAPGFKRAGFETITLSKIFRQNDEVFIDILNGIRHKVITPAQMSLLNEQVDPVFPTTSSGYIVLTARNQEADDLNHRNLINLVGESRMYRGTVGGEFKENDTPAPIQLQLKVGAKVMFVKNDMSEEKRYVNGTIGTIVIMNAGIISVEVDGALVTVKPETWEQQRYQYDEDNNEWESIVVGTFNQFPLKLAWAITIHKSQGKTFDKVYLDLGARAFAHGQTYVALSRCTTLQGLLLKRPLKFNDIIVDPEVQAFNENGSIMQSEFAF
jgi:ATP-dependent DNA helicase PIF1